MIVIKLYINFNTYYSEAIEYPIHQLSVYKYRTSETYYL